MNRLPGSLKRRQTPSSSSSSARAEMREAAEKKFPPACSPSSSSSLFHGSRRGERRIGFASLPPAFHGQGNRGEAKEKVSFSKSFSFPSQVLLLFSSASGGGGTWKSSPLLLPPALKPLFLLARSLPRAGVTCIRLLLF